MRIQKVRIITLVEYTKQDNIDWGKDESTFVGTTAEATTKTEEVITSTDEDDEDF